MPNPFPNIQLADERKGQDDFNPAIQLFGRRFFTDQTVTELLLEFLLVATSQKRIAGTDVPPETLIPSLDSLRVWPDGECLKYAPKARLNLKLFAFLGASKLDTRHQSHREHYKYLIKELCSDGKLNAGALDVDDVIKTLENLFLGFQSIGGQRTWCAAQFLPITRQMISGESIWRDKQARAKDVKTWDDAVPLFDHTQHIFLARGGELLYLQICNALRQDASILKNWSREAALSLSPRESDPAALHQALCYALGSVMDACPETVGKLAEFLDCGIDPTTAHATDNSDLKPRFIPCGWCPSESWQEGMLFAVELLRICDATLDPIERLELIEVACAMQLLRSLSAQSTRQMAPEEGASCSALRYLWAISDPEGDHFVLKQISRRNINAVQRRIHDALRHPEILGKFDGLPDRDDIYKKADSRYGHKLFLSIAKRIGFIVPKRGAGARFTFTDRLLRFFVLALLRPGERVTYETFKKLLLAHYGIAVDDEALAAACEWSGSNRLSTLGGKADAWLIEMLIASGFLIRLSDSCSLVMNPFNGKEISR